MVNTLNMGCKYVTSYFSLIIEVHRDLPKRSEFCFTSPSAQSCKYREIRKPEAGTMPYSYFEWFQAKNKNAHPPVSQRQTRHWGMSEEQMMPSGWGDRAWWVIF